MKNILCALCAFIIMTSCAVFSAAEQEIPQTSEITTVQQTQSLTGVEVALAVTLVVVGVGMIIAGITVLVKRKSLHN